MSDLISTSYAKDYMRITTSGTDDLIDQIISAVSSQIERHCDRKFNEATYRQWLDGKGFSELRIPQYPITRLYRVATNRLCIGKISFSGSDSVATAGLSSSGVLTLANITSSGTESFKDILLAGKNLTELSTSVGAETGWSIAITGPNANESVRDMRPFTDWSADNNAFDLTIPCEAVEARVRSWTEDTIESVDDSGFHGLGSGIPAGRSNVFVWWKAGYNPIPDGLQQATAQIVKQVFDSTTQDASLESEKIGDYSYKLNTKLVGQTVAGADAELFTWCRKEL